MTPKCDCCGERIDNLNHQVSVMRKEIKNLRRMLDTATRTHHKHMLAIQSAVAKTAASKPTTATAAPPGPPPPAASASSEPPPAASASSEPPAASASSEPPPAASASSEPPPAASASSEPPAASAPSEPPPAASASSEPPAAAAAASASLQHIGLEQGNIQTIPIGYISSCFSLKNGTPRQPTICGPSRAELRIKHSVFSNPEHALVGLEQYSHVWIIFLFHKNGHLKYKAKVKPPRLNGQRVGVYSTRSPHRPNVLGLTLAKMDRIVGDTIHLSDVDMIAGTPVLDIKPYIPEYDSPHARTIMDFETSKPNPKQPKASTCASTNMLNVHCNSETDILSNSEGEITDDDDHRSYTPRDRSEDDTPNTDSSESALPLALPDDTHVLEEVKAYVNQSDLCQLPSDHSFEALDSKNTEPQDAMEKQPSYGEGAYSTIAGWIREPPVSSLEVRFTPHAEKELGEFLPAVLSGFPESKRPRFRFLHSSEEAAAAIRGVLSADPRSVYRRNHCKDKLFFFTLDTADITCWFGQGFAEVLQVRPVERPFASM